MLVKPSLLTFLSDDLQIHFLSIWLDVRSLTTLDVAVSSHRWRPRWLTLLQYLRSKALDDWGHSLSSMMWLSRRGIRASRLEMKIDTSRVRGCNILLVDTSNLELIELQDCIDITDQCIVDVINRCTKLRSINLEGCGNVTDAGVTALGAGCGLLQYIDLEGCSQVTGAGVTALGAGCGKLQYIDLEGCWRVTDAGISALGAGCGQLQSINLWGCINVSDAGISALGAGCGKLQNINL